MLHHLVNRLFGVRSSTASLDPPTVTSDDADNNDETSEFMASTPSARYRQKREHELSIQGDSTVVSGSPYKRRRSTSMYIYNTLFCHGEDADVSVTCCGRQWRLHRVYLRQAGYFEALFSLRWESSSSSPLPFSETDDGLRVVTLESEDVNVDGNALHVCFESLYSDDVIVAKSDLVSVLAAATMLQMDGLIEHCVASMAQNISMSTVSSYYQSGRAYGHCELATYCVTYTARNLSLLGPSSYRASVLVSICPELLLDAVKSPSLIVVHIEFDLYLLLREWLMLTLQPDSTACAEGLTLASAVYFRTLGMGTDSSDSMCGNPIDNTIEVNSVNLNRSACGTAFLLTKVGEPYVPIFRALRFRHLINDSCNMEILQRDLIIPMSWLTPAFRDNWLALLAGAGSYGPRESLASTALDVIGFRCGRVLDHDIQMAWRWTFFSFGVDLVVTYSDRARCLFFKRNTKTLPATFSNGSSLVCLNALRQLTFKLSVHSLDDNGLISPCDAVDELSTDVVPEDRNSLEPMTLRTPRVLCTTELTLQLRNNEEVLVAALGLEMKFPLVISLIVSYPPVLDQQQPTKATD